MRAITRTNYQRKKTTKKGCRSSMGFKEIFDAMNVSNEVDGDYRKDGFLYCGKCNTRKQADIPSPEDGDMLRCFVLCECEQKKRDEENNLIRKQKRETRIARLRMDGISDKAYEGYIFANDDGRNQKITEMCKLYIEKWEDVKRNNIGILFSGACWNGKVILCRLYCKRFDRQRHKSENDNDSRCFEHEF